LAQRATRPEIQPGHGALKLYTFEELQLDLITSKPSVGLSAEIGLLTLAGKVGRLMDEVASGQVSENTERLSQHLVDIFRALIAAANSTGVSLAECARANLDKIDSRWPLTRRYCPLFDEHEEPEERLPRRLEVSFLEKVSRDKAYVRIECNGVNLGDRLTDNKLEPDDYRFHDVFHLAYAAILGWSPVTRALFKVKRKSKPLIDETEDGARASMIEEGISTWVFNHARRLDYFASIRSLDYSLLKGIREFVAGYEVERVPLWQWEEAILEGYRVFRLLKERRGGLVIADLVRRSISVAEQDSPAERSTSAR
jgi:hypothetical protein